MKERPISVAASIKREDDGTYTVVVEIVGLSRDRAFEVTENLEQPVCNVLEKFGDLRQVSTGFGHA